MTLETLKNAKRVIGIKQVTKAVNKGLTTCVFLAVDADERVVGPLRQLCGEKQIMIEESATMTELGNTCSIEVGAAAVGILQ